MKKTKFLALILCLSFLCTLLLPATAYADDPPAGSGMKYSKTATANKDGSYTITLEAFATGSQTTSTQTEDVPTDIILVLDQSGSMKDPMGGYTYTAYQKASGWFDSRNYYNEEYFPLRHNGGSGNLWHKLNNNEYIAVSVEQEMVYTPISGWDNGAYYSNQNNLYCLVNREYKEVRVDRELGFFVLDYTYYVDGSKIGSGSGSSETPTFNDGYAPLYQSVKKYTYSYTLNGSTTKIDESIGADASPSTQFYKREYSSSAGGKRIDALKSAANAFASAVAAKAAGPDGDINAAADNVNHRIAVVGYACGDRYNHRNYDYKNTEVFIGSNQYKYGSAAQGQYSNAFQSMTTSSGVSNVNASINALETDGGTLTNLGLEMANGIFANNPINNGETRNRVVILFTDGVPGWSGYESNVANSAITQASTAKNTHGATVYSIGIFAGADATSPGNQGGSETAKANWFMQNVSSNNGTPNYPSYYLSAGDSASLNNIFQQISNNITTGGTTSTLTSDAVVKDIISPQFTLPEGATASSITLETYRCTGKNGSDYTWSKNTDAMGAKASISGDQVNVTGFNFSENYVGTVTEGNSVTYRGHKLVISFKVQPKAGFLGGNDVPTNASAGIYENASAQNPVMTFEQPKVNVPIKDVTVTATDKNVYLKGEVTADQLKSGATVTVGEGTKAVSLDLSKANENYGLADWQTEFVNITVAVKDKDGIPISDKLDNLTDDTTYTVEVTVAPKTVGTSTPAKGNAATAKTGVNDPAANIYVFKPELTFKDSTAYYGETVPANNDYSSNKVGSETWKHDNKEAVPAEMTGNKPDLTIAYTPDGTKLDGTKYGKQDVPVTAAVKIGTENVNEHTTFVHQDCTGKTCALPEGYHFWIHIQTCTLNITKQGGADNESYVFDVFKDGVKYSEVTVWGNGTETLVELPIGTYTISENTGWSWRYPNPTYTTAIELSAAQTSGTITCTNTLKNNYWLNGFSQVVKNIFGISH